MGESGRSSWKAAAIVTVVALAMLLLWALAGGDHSERTDRSTVAIDSAEPAVPKPAENETETLADESAAKVTVTVLDLGNRAPLSGVAVRFAFKSKGAVTATSDSRGVLEIHARDLELLKSLQLDGAPGLTIASSPKKVRQRRQIWCYRLGAVTGRVVFEGADAPSFGEVRLGYAPPFSVDADSSAPGSMVWMRGNRAFHRKSLGTPDAEGRFRVDVPRVSGGAIVARASGWAPGWDLIDSALTKPSGELVLILRPAYRIRGSLRDRAGEPIVGETVRVFVVLKTKFDDTGAIGRLKDSGYTVKRSLKDDLAVHKLSYSARTDKDGRWTVDVGADGDVYAISYPRGRAPAESHLGQASAIAREINLTSSRSMPQRIKIEKDRRPLANAHLRCLDISLLDAQPAFNLTTDGGGYAETTWFVRGKLYSLLGTGAHFKYTGQRKIVIEECESNLDRFLDQQGVPR